MPLAALGMSTGSSAQERVFYRGTWHLNQHTNWPIESKCAKWLQAEDTGTMDLPDECVPGGTGMSNRSLRRATKAATAAAEEAVSCMTETTPLEVRALVDVVKQQASLMARYQQQLDATNARLTQSQKLLSRLADSTPVRPHA